MGAGANRVAQAAGGGPIDWGSVALSAGIGGVSAGVGAKLMAAREVNNGRGTELGRPPASDDRIQLFRHVDAVELQDIKAIGEFRLGLHSTGKYFAESAEHAREWGQLLNKGEGAIVETILPRSVADEMYHWPKLDSIGPARFASPERLQWFNSVTDGIRILP